MCPQAFEFVDKWKCSVVAHAARLSVVRRVVASGHKIASRHFRKQLVLQVIRWERALAAEGRAELSDSAASHVSDAVFTGGGPPTCEGDHVTKSRSETRADFQAQAATRAANWTLQTTTLPVPATACQRHQQVFVVVVKKGFSSSAKPVQLIIDNVGAGGARYSAIALQPRIRVLYMVQLRLCQRSFRSQGLQLTGIACWQLELTDRNAIPLWCRSVKSSYGSRLLRPCVAILLVCVEHRQRSPGDRNRVRIQRWLRRVLHVKLRLRKQCSRAEQYDLQPRRERATNADET